MKFGANLMLSAATRLYIALLALFAIVLLATRPPGEGVGFVAGLAVALLLTLHGLVFGLAAARAAMPPLAARALMCAGLLALPASAFVPAHNLARQILEAGLFAMTVSGASLILTVLIGRAPALRDAQW